MNNPFRRHEEGQRRGETENRKRKKLRMEDQSRETQREKSRQTKNNTTAPEMTLRQRKHGKYRIWSYAEDSKLQDTFLRGIIIFVLGVSSLLLILYIFYGVTGYTVNLFYALEEASNWMLLQIMGFIIIAMGILAGLIKNVKSSTGILIFGVGIVVLLIGFSDFGVLNVLNNTLIQLALSVMAILGSILAITYLIR